MMTLYSMPTPSAAAIVASAGSASFITAWQDMFNPRAADSTRIQWGTLTGGLANNVAMQFTIPSTVVRGVALIGLNVLGLTDMSGFKVVITGRRATDGVGNYPYDLGGTSQSTRTFKRDDGSYAAICVCASGLTAIVGYQVAIYNDQNGASPITASQFVDLGNIWASPGFDLDIDTDWRLTFAANKLPQSINYQPWPVIYPNGRVLSFSRREMDFNTAFVTGANPSWQALRTLIGNGQPSILIPRWGTAASPDATKIHATAVYGMASFSEFDHFPGDYFSVSCQSVETPALLA
jgi:hypothetical protein